MSPHVQAQLLRFARTTALSFLVLYIQAGGHLSWSSLWAVGPGVAETLLREARPVNPLPRISSVLVTPSPVPASGGTLAAPLRLASPPPAPAGNIGGDLGGPPG